MKGTTVEENNCLHMERSYYARGLGKMRREKNRPLLGKHKCTMTAISIESAKFYNFFLSECFSQRSNQNQ